MDTMERLDGYLRGHCGDADALFHFLRFECPELIADIGRAYDFLHNDLARKPFIGPLSMHLPTRDILCRIHCFSSIRGNRKGLYHAAFS